MHRQAWRAMIMCSAYARRLLALQCHAYALLRVSSWSHFRTSWSACDQLSCSAGSSSHVAQVSNIYIWNAWASCNIAIVNINRNTHDPMSNLGLEFYLRVRVHRAVSYTSSASFVGPKGLTCNCDTLIMLSTITSWKHINPFLLSGIKVCCHNSAFLQLYTGL